MIIFQRVLEKDGGRGREREKDGGSKWGWEGSEGLYLWYFNGKQRNKSKGLL